MGKSSKFSVIEEVNKLVISGLEEKGLNWFKPWTNKDGLIQQPVSWEHGTAYKGVNRFALNHYASMYNHDHNQWLTYKQAEKAGGKPQKGKSRMVVLYQIKYMVVIKRAGKKTEYKWLDKKSIALAVLNKAKKSGATATVETKWLDRYFNVWNVADVEGVEPKTNKRLDAERKAYENRKFTPNQRAEEVIKGWSNKPTINHEGSQAFYRPSTDSITMPEQKAFLDSDGYYKTLFHECIHATGHKSRLNRDTLTNDALNANTTAKQVYSKEELVAEIGSMYLTGICELECKDSDTNSKAYINGWIKHLKDHKYEASSAMQRAEKAVDHILNPNTK